MANSLNDILASLIHGGEQGQFNLPLLAGLAVTGGSDHHESDFRIESLGDPITHAHFGHNPSLAVAGDGPGSETIFGGLLTNGSDSAVVASSGDTPVAGAAFGDDPSLHALNVLDSSDLG